jgi:hypothetical protein
MPIVRQHLDQWLAKIQIIFNDENMGHARLLIDGLTDVGCAVMQSLGCFAGVIASLFTIEVPRTLMVRTSDRPARPRGDRRITVAEPATDLLFVTARNGREFPLGVAALYDPGPLAFTESDGQNIALHL